MQQINLYLPEFRPSRDPLRAVHMAWGLLGFFILLLLVTVYTNRQHAQSLQQLAQAQQAQQALLAQLQTITPQKSVQANVGADSAGTDIDAKIQQLQQTLQRREQLLAMISSQSLGNQKGFSAQLTTLGQASLNTISLETFSLQKGGTYAELTGKTRSADQIPLYLQKLRADASFANVGFGVLNMERDKKVNGLLQFSLAKTKPTDTTRPSFERAKAAELNEKQNEKLNDVRYLTLTQADEEGTTKGDKP